MATDARRDDPKRIRAVQCKLRTQTWASFSTPTLTWTVWMASTNRVTSRAPYEPTKPRFAIALRAGGLRRASVQVHSTKSSRADVARQ